MEPRKNYGRTINGELITDELIEKLALEAEEGWEVEEISTWREVVSAPPITPTARARRGKRRPRRRP